MTEIEQLKWQVEQLMNRVAALEKDQHNHYAKLADNPRPEITLEAILSRA